MEKLKDMLCNKASANYSGNTNIFVVFQCCIVYCCFLDLLVKMFRVRYKAEVLHSCSFSHCSCSLLLPVISYHCTKMSEWSIVAHLQHINVFGANVRTFSSNEYITLTAFLLLPVSGNVLEALLRFWVPIGRYFLWPCVF